jgi:hypothetical protein
MRASRSRASSGRANRATTVITEEDLHMFTRTLALSALLVVAAGLGDRVEAATVVYKHLACALTKFSQIDVPGLIISLAVTNV